MRLTPGGALSLPSVEFNPFGEVGYGEVPVYGGCRRVVGSAPDRRVVWTFVGAPGEPSWEVAFFERGGAIELRYDAPSMRWVSPSIRVGAAQLIFPPVQIGRATLVRVTLR